MTKDERISSIDPGLHSRCKITYRVALSLEIMMLPGHPGRLLTGILYEFIHVEFPHDVTIPVNLYEVNLVHITIFGISFAQASHNISSWKNLVWKAMKSLPKLNDRPIHVD